MGISNLLYYNMSTNYPNFRGAVRAGSLEKNVTGRNGY